MHTNLNIIMHIKIYSFDFAYQNLIHTHIFPITLTNLINQLNKLLVLCLFTTSACGFIPVGLWFQAAHASIIPPLFQSHTPYIALALYKTHNWINTFMHIHHAFNNGYFLFLAALLLPLQPFGNLPPLICNHLYGPNPASQGNL